MPKLSPDHHVYPWTEHGGGKMKAKKVYIVIPRSLSNEAPKSIEDAKALLQPAQQQFSGLESQFLDMVQDLIIGISIVEIDWWSWLIKNFKYQMQMRTI
jgi:hypothetical protein